MPRHRSIIAALILSLIPFAALMLTPPSQQIDAKSNIGNAVNDGLRAPAGPERARPAHPRL